MVILELKFTDRFPDWFRDLVEHFELFQCGAAKYCDGVEKIAEKISFQWLGAGAQLEDWAEVEQPPQLVSLEG